MRAVFAVILIICLLPGGPSQAVPTKGHRMMAAAVNPHAIRVAQRTMEKGGNVVDVAVAMGLTLAVTAPYYAAFGGGGFALVRMDNKVEALDFREVAPKATSPKFYMDKGKKASREGGAAVGVPGWPAGLQALHEKYGKLDWSQLFFEAKRLARRGFRVSGEWVYRTKQAEDYFTKTGQKHFMKDEKVHYKPGDRIKQKKLFRALQAMQTRKSIPFYTGDIARDIVKSVQKSGGVLTLKDLKEYKVRWLEPQKTKFANHKVYLMPPPSSGGVVIESALYLTKKLKLTSTKNMSVDEYHLLGEILNRSFRGRSLLGDEPFHDNPLKQLLSPSYLNKMAKSINRDKVVELDPLTEKKLNDNRQTTHYSIVDQKGNAVSLTVTLNGSYGSGVVSEKYGIALNNEMDDFTTRPGEPNMFGLIQGKGNFVEPGKRPLSSMSPVIAVGKKGSVLAIGAPGGPRIISGVYQALYRILGRNMNVDRAIQTPRVHNQFLPRKLFVDENRFTPETLEGLKKRGHNIEESWNSRVFAVHKKPNGLIEAAFDSRGEGAAGGL